MYTFCSCSWWHVFWQFGGCFVCWWLLLIFTIIEILILYKLAQTSCSKKKEVSFYRCHRLQGLISYETMLFFSVIMLFYSFISALVSLPTAPIISALWPHVPHLQLQYVRNLGRSRRSWLEINRGMSMMQDARKEVVKAGSLLPDAQRTRWWKEECWKQRNPETQSCDSDMRKHLKASDSSFQQRFQHLPSTGVGPGDTTRSTKWSPPLRAWSFGN